MSKINHHRSFHTVQDDSFLKTMHDGFNYFHEIDFSTSQLRQVKHKIRSRAQRAHTTISDRQQHRSLLTVLNKNKQQFTRIKTQMNYMREVQLNDYIKKSLKYQQILNINDNKKKRLPTLNTKVGEVIKKSVVQATSKNIQYSLTTITVKLQGWKPQSRQGHTTTIYKNTAVIIGGHCSYPFATAQVYNFEMNSWVKQFQLLTARSYHSAIFYKNRFIIIFGGMGSYDVSRKCRVCFNTINLIDLQTWTPRVLKMNNQESIEGRRGHGAVLMGKYMLVFGGINTKKQFLKDFVYLDLKQLRWYHKQYKCQGKQLDQQMQYGLAKHKIVSSFKSTHKSLPLYSSQYSDSEGLYMIGGGFGNGDDSIILFMGFNRYNPYIKKVQYVGIPPSSVQPIVEKMNDNILIILSGELSQRSIKLFKIKEREFTSINKFINPAFLGGLGSTLSKYNEDFYFFFGVSNTGYIGSLNSIKIQEKIIQNEQKHKKSKIDELEWKQQKQLSSSSISSSGL